MTTADHIAAAVAADPYCQEFPGACTYAPASELRVGMTIVEADGYMLPIVSVTTARGIVEVMGRSAMGAMVRGRMRARSLVRVAVGDPWPHAPEGRHAAEASP